jgi:hypothetical protein
MEWDVAAQGDAGGAGSLEMVSAMRRPSEAGYLRPPRGDAHGTCDQGVRASTEIRSNVLTG